MPLTDLLDEALEPADTDCWDWERTATRTRICRLLYYEDVIEQSPHLLVVACESIGTENVRIETRHHRKCG